MHLRVTIQRQILVCRGVCLLPRIVTELIVPMFMPDAGKPAAYPTRTGTTFRRTSRRRNTQRVFLCRGGRRVGMQACPFGSSLAQTTTKYAQESLRALSFRKRWISPLLKASPECPLRDMRQASRLGDGWHYGDARRRGLFR